MIYSSDIVNDVLAVSLESTATRTFTISIDCYDGHDLTASRVLDNAAIEAKHNAAGSYTDIEHEPLDLSTWAGTAPDFNFRITAGTITDHATEAFRLRAGQSATSVSGWATFNSVGITFNGQAVNFSPDNVYFDGEQATFNSLPLTFAP